MILLIFISCSNQDNKLFVLKTNTDIDFNNKLSPIPDLNDAYKKQVFELASCYFENIGKNKFKKIELPFLTQISSIRALYLDDLNKDGFEDILIAGNDYNISTQLGRLDAFHGTLILNDQKGFFTVKPKQSFDISGQARDIKKISVNGKAYFIVSVNNSIPVFLKNNE